MPKKNAASKRTDAERAAEHYAREVHGCVLINRAVRKRFHQVDFFGADIEGKRPDGSHVYLQVTAGQASAVTARRRKLEKVPWHVSDHVELLQLVQTEDPANARRKKWFFRVHTYTAIAGGVWTTLPDAVEVPRQWFKAYKEEEE